MLTAARVRRKKRKWFAPGIQLHQSVHGDYLRPWLHRCSPFSPFHHAVLRFPYLFLH